MVKASLQKKNRKAGGGRIANITIMINNIGAFHYLQKPGIIYFITRGHCYITQLPFL